MLFIRAPLFLLLSPPFSFPPLACLFPLSSFRVGTTLCSLGGKRRGGGGHRTSFMVCRGAKGETFTDSTLRYIDILLLRASPGGIASMN